MSRTAVSTGISFPEQAAKHNDIPGRNNGRSGINIPQDNNAAFCFQHLSVSQRPSVELPVSICALPGKICLPQCFYKGLIGFIILPRKAEDPQL